jgi:SAM-dependent methyltransferase
MPSHERDLAMAFDAQAEQFERAPVQADPGTLARLVEFAALPPDSWVLDAGCGPGLVAEAFLAAGHRVFGMDLSQEMVRRARSRCARFGPRAEFEVASVYRLSRADVFDAAISRLVIHHVEDPAAFLRAQLAHVRAHGVIVVSDHEGDPEPTVAWWHQQIERGRDRTHTTSLTPGGLVDLFARAGLRELSLVEETFELDFDEWFDRGTPALPKEEVRALLLAGRARAFDPAVGPDGSISIRNGRVNVRGVKAGEGDGDAR